MVFERMAGVDTDELFCPVCGRRILVQWYPRFRRTILAPGNENATHTLSRSDTQVGNPVANRTEAMAAPATADPARLADWERCLQEIDFESWWR